MTEEEKYIFLNKIGDIREIFFMDWNLAFEEKVLESLNDLSEKTELVSLLIKRCKQMIYRLEILK